MCDCSIRVSQYVVQHSCPLQLIILYSHFAHRFYLLIIPKSLPAKSMCPYLSVTSYFITVTILFSFTANLFCMVNSTDLVVKEDTYCYH